MLAPNSPLRTAVTALALAATTWPPAPKLRRAAESPHRRAARYAWAALLALIYAVFPLVCPLCGAEMRVIAFITDPPTIHDILDLLGEHTAPPRMRPPSARRSGTCRMPGQAASTPQPAPEYEFDQRIPGSAERRPPFAHDATAR